MNNRLHITLFFAIMNIHRLLAKGIGFIVLMLVMLFSVNASAQSLYECIQVRDSNRVVDGERYTVVTFGSRVGCDLYLAARMYPQMDPETKKPLTIQAQLRSIYAANRGRIINGLRTAPTVQRGCIPRAKPWPDQTLEEQEYCPGLVNYFPIPRNGHYAEVFIPHRPQQTITEKLVGLSETSCRALAEYPNPPPKTQALLASCRKYFKDIVIPKPTVTKDQLSLQHANETIAMHEEKIAQKTMAIAALTPLANERLLYERWMFGMLAFGLVFGVGGVGLAGASFRRSRRLYSLAFLRKEELDSQVRDIRNTTEQRIKDLEEQAKQKEQLETQLQQLQVERVSLKSSAETFETELREARKKIAALGDRLIDFWFALVASEDTPELRERFEQLDHTAKIETIQSRVKTLETQKQEQYAKLMSAETRAQALQNRIDHLTASLEEAQKKNDALQADLEEAQTELSNERKISAAQLAHARERADQHLQSQKSTKAEYEHKCAELEAQQALVAAMQSDLDEAAAEIGRLKQELHVHEETYRTAQERMRMVEDQRNKLQQEAKDVQSALNAAESRCEQASLEQASARTKISNLEALHAEAQSAGQKAYAALEHKHHALQSVLGAAQARCEQAENALAAAQARVAELERVHGREQALDTELATARQSIQVLEKQRDQLRIALQSSQEEAVALRLSVEKLRVALGESEAETVCVVDMYRAAKANAEELNEQLNVANSALADSQTSNDQLRKELDVVRRDMSQFETRIEQLRTENQKLRHDLRRMHEDFISPSRHVAAVKSDQSETFEATVFSAPAPSGTRAIASDEQAGQAQSADTADAKHVAQAAVKTGERNAPGHIVIRIDEDEAFYKTQYLQLRGALRVLLDQKRQTLMDLLTRIDGSVEKTEQLQEQIQLRLATSDGPERNALEKKAVDIDRALRRLRNEQRKDVELRLDRLPSLQSFDEDHDRVMYFINDACVPEAGEERDRFAKQMAWDILVAELSTQMTEKSLQTEYEKLRAEQQKLRQDYEEVRTAYFELADTIIEIHDLDYQRFRAMEYPERRAYLTGPMRTIMGDHRRHEQELRALSIRLNDEQQKRIKVEKDRDSFRRYSDEQTQINQMLQADLIMIREEYADYRRKAKESRPASDSGVLELAPRSKRISVPPPASIPREASGMAAVMQDGIASMRIEDLRLLSGTNLAKLTGNCVRVIAERHASREAVEFPIADIEDVYLWNDFLHIPLVSEGYRFPDVLQDVLRSKQALRVLHLVDESCTRPPASAEMLQRYTETQRPSAIGPFMPHPGSGQPPAAPPAETDIRSLIETPDERKA